MGEEIVPLQLETIGQPKSMQIVLYGEKPLSKILVGIHNPHDFTVHIAILNLCEEIQRREEEWKKEKQRLKKEIQKRDEVIEEKNEEIATLKKKVDNIVTLVP